MSEIVVIMCVAAVVAVAFYLLGILTAVKLTEKGCWFDDN